MADFANFIGMAADNDFSLMRNRILDMQIKESMANLNVGADDAKDRAAQLASRSILDSEQEAMQPTQNNLLRVPQQQQMNAPQPMQLNAPAQATQRPDMRSMMPNAQRVAPQMTAAQQFGFPQIGNQNALTQPPQMRMPGQMPQIPQNPEMFQQGAPPAMQPQGPKPIVVTPQEQQMMMRQQEQQNAPVQQPTEAQQSAPTIAPPSNAIKDVEMDREKIVETLKSVNSAPITKAIKNVEATTTNKTVKSIAAEYSRAYQELEMYDAGINTIVDRIKTGSNDKYELVAWSKKLDALEAKKKTAEETYIANGARFVSATLPTIIESNDKETLQNVKDIISKDKFLRGTPLANILNTMKIRGPELIANVPVTMVGNNLPDVLKEWAGSHPNEKVQVTFIDGQFTSMKPVDPKYAKGMELWSDTYEKDYGDGRKLLMRRNLLTNKEEKVDAQPAGFSFTGEGMASEIEAAARAVAEKRWTLDKVTTRAGIREKVMKRADQISNEMGHGDINFVGDIADVKAGQSSQTFVTKQLDASGSFIGTIDRNIEMFENHIKDMATRHNLPASKIAMMPWREFMKLAGDSDINIYAMLVNAISTENAKLVSGGAGSVAQVTEGARVDMAKIHDENLPVGEMIKLMKKTREEGSNRISALKEQVDVAKGRSSEIRKKVTPATIQIGDMYKGKRVVRVGDEKGKVYVMLEGAKGPVEVK